MEDYVTADDGAQIFYQQSGESASDADEAIVMLPGWSFSGDIFADQIAHFSKSHKVIAIDPRGQGKSTKKADGDTYLQQGTDIAAVLDSLKLKKIIFIGWSWGCYGIFSYVRQFGAERIERFICLDEPPCAWSNNSEDWAEVHSLDAFVGLYQAVAFNRASFTVDFIKTMVTRELSNSELEALLAMSHQTPDHIAVALAVDGMMSDYSTEAILLDQSMPVLYIIREEAFSEAAPWMKEHMPNTELYFKGGHLMFWEFSEDINQILDRFLD